MDFTLTDEQEMLRDTARGLFAKEFPSSLVRAACYDPTPTGAADAADAFDRHLRDWFVLGDGDLVDLCLFLEESGVAVPVGPLWSTTALCLPLLRAIGHPDADAMAAGELTGTVALAGPDGTWVANDSTTKSFVPDADRVDRLVVVHHAGDVISVAVAHGGDLPLVPVRSLDRARPVFDVDTTALWESAGGGLAGSEVAPGVLGGVLGRATVALAAELVGVARWLREATLAYVCERVQFGVPVGSFQGLQWKLVDAALVHERACAAVQYAAMCVDADSPDAASAVHVAKASAGTAARRWAADGLQAHGGIGYTWEHDLHLRLRRAHSSDRLLGDSTHHHGALAAAIFQTDQLPD